MMCRYADRFVRSRLRARRAGLASTAVVALAVCVFSPAAAQAQAQAQAGPGALSVLEQTVEVDGVSFHVRTAGTGPPLLLLHGFTGAGRWWDPLLEDLAARHTLIIPDLPLHGRSTGRPEWRYSDVAGDVLALMDTLGVTAFRAVGYSAGGEVLLHMAARQPQRLEAMVLLAAVHRLSDENRETLRNWPSFEEMPQHVREYWMEVHPGGAAQVQVLSEALRAVADHEDAMNFTVDDLAPMTAPTLVVIGDRDSFAPLETAVELIRGLPTASLWVVPGQGHSPVLEDWGGSPEAQRVFADVINRFFENTSR